MSQNPLDAIPKIRNILQTIPAILSEIESKLNSNPNVNEIQSIRQQLLELQTLVGGWISFLYNLQIQASGPSHMPISLQTQQRDLRNVYVTIQNQLHRVGEYPQISTGIILNGLTHPRPTGALYYGIGQPRVFTKRYIDSPMVTVSPMYGSDGILDVNGGYGLSTTGFTPLSFGSDTGATGPYSQYLVVGERTLRQ
jgi:hypothetical protein